MERCPDATSKWFSLETMPGESAPPGVRRQGEPKSLCSGAVACGRPLPVFESFYYGALHHPLWSWVSVLLVLGAVRGVFGDRPPRFHDPFVRTFLVVFALEIALDAWCTGGWTPLGEGGLAQNLAIVFVILGDWRYFVLVERYATDGPPRGGPSPWLRALLWALLIPIISGVGTRVFPEFFSSSRWIFLVYELMFLGLALFLGLFVLPRRLAAAPPAVRGHPVRPVVVR